MPSVPFDITQTLFWKILLRVVRFVMVSYSVISTACIIYSLTLRYIFQKNFYGSDEVILMFAFWLYFMGAVHGSYENSHIKADLLNVYIKNLRVKDVMGLIAQFLTIVVNAILLFWAWDYFLWGLNKMPLSTGLKIPLVIPQSAIFFSLLLMVFYHICYFCINIHKFTSCGYFSVPQYGDYITEKLKARYSTAAAPLKAEVEAMLKADEEAEKQKGDGQ